MTAVDISAEAVQMTEVNAAKNGLDKIVKGLKANVFDLLSELVNSKSRAYDFIILDRRRLQSRAVRSKMPSAAIKRSI